MQCDDEDNKLNEINPMIKTFAVFSTGILIILILVLVAITFGSITISPTILWNLLWNADALPENTASIRVILLELRLPRAILALCVGGGLGVVGCLLQTVTRNDLADPFLFGLSSGAAAGAVLVISFWGDVLGMWTMPAASFSGAMLAALTVILLIQKMGNNSPERLVLAGLAVSFLFTALTNFLVFAGDQRAAHSVLFWSLGGLGLARWGNLPFGVMGGLLLLVYGWKNHRRLDALLAGEETARSLGIRLRYFRMMVFLISACGTAIFVSLVGVIGFIGLMVPHMARWFVGPLHRGVIPLSAIIGAILLLTSDITSRLVLAPQELPVGIVTTALGAVFVFGLLINGKS